MNYHGGYDGYNGSILVGGYFQDAPSRRGIFTDLFNDGYDPYFSYGSPNYYN